jgi:hypothetical protein
VSKLKAVVSSLLIVAATNSRVALAVPELATVDTCLAAFVKSLAQKDEVTSSRNMMTTCACFVNRRVQGLSPYDCPKFSTVTAAQMREAFGGNY